MLFPFFVNRFLRALRTLLKMHDLRSNSIEHRASKSSPGSRKVGTNNDINDPLFVAHDHLSRFTIQTELLATDPDVVFCHNDLLCGNILYDDGGQTPEAHFIDFEYGGELLMNRLSMSDGLKNTLLSKDITTATSTSATTFAR